MLAQSPASFALATLRYAPSAPCRWTHLLATAELGPGMSGANVRPEADHLVIGHLDALIGAAPH
jgi:hypothetical protein